MSLPCFIKEYFANELIKLQPLVEDGLVRVTSSGIVVTEQGRLLKNADRVVAVPKEPKPTVIPIPTAVGRGISIVFDH